MRASATVATIRARLYYTHTKSARKERKKKKGKFKQTVTKTKRDVVRCSRAETTTTKINAPVFTTRAKLRARSNANARRV